MELVSRIFSGADEETREAIDSLARTTKVAANVAERLLTGRRAEDYFMSHCLGLLNIRTEYLLDYRNAAVGYDFGASDNPKTAIEVKGIKNRRGDVLFTDREWREAKVRQRDYWLVIVGNLVDVPKAAVIRDPSSVLSVSCRYQRSISVSWTSNVSVV